MRSAPLVLCLSLLTCMALAPSRPARAQDRDDVPSLQETNGYTIRLIHMQRGSYGYEIRRGPQVLIHQRRNPFTGSEEGLSRRLDALNAARWVLENVVMTDRMRPRQLRLPEGGALERFIPNTVAASLGVTLDKTR